MNAVILLSFLCCIANCKAWFSKLGPEQKESESSDTEAAVNKAKKWLRDQRLPQYGWGSDTPRAMVALALSGSKDLDEVNEKLMNKELEVQIAFELLKGDLHSVPLPRLAQYINALIASCRDPRHFLDQDLVNVLRNRTNYSKDSGLSPSIILTLCILKESDMDDWRALERTSRSQTSLQRHPLIRRYDMEAYTAIATACVMQKSTPQIQDRYSKRFFDAFNHTLNEYIHGRSRPDVYTLALLLQALNAWSQKAADSNVKRENLERSLLELQKEDGSFGDILATYYAIPALSKKSLYDLSHTDCSGVKIGRQDSFPVKGDRPINVTISLLVTKEDDLESHSINFNVGLDWTLLDAMKVAASKNPVFRFEYDDDSELGKVVYKINNIPNDPERRLYWLLYHTMTDITPVLKRELNTGVDHVVLHNGDHITFWYRKKRALN